jgi:hypothetical protein
VEPERARRSLSDVLDRALAEPARREAWLSAFVRTTAPLGAATATLWERRREVASRLGLADPDALIAPGPDVPAAAERWLARTDSAFDDLARPTLAGLIDLALGTAAAEGWPSRLLPRTLLDLFRETELFRALDLEPGELPAAFGPASFLRALARVGAAWVDATAPRDQPFVVAHDPGGLARRRMGALLAMLPAASAFSRRALRVPAPRVPDHSRALSTALLVESRAAAFRVLLRPAAFAGARSFQAAFETGTERTFRVPVPPVAVGALWQLHGDDLQRFAGLLLAATQGTELRAAHDDDWYRNPRATEQLRDEAARPPDVTTTADALERGADALYAVLTTALG